ncbi:helix-turn-helix domain-containing protein [Niabella aquatica]
MEINDIKIQLDAIIARLAKLENHELQTYTSEEVCKILRISKRTLQSLRDEGQIGFCQNNNTIRYTRSHIEQYFKRYDISTQKSGVITMHRKKSA